MKRILLALCILLGLAGCQQASLEPTSETVNVQFNVLQVEQIPMSRAALKDACSSLNYYRYTDGELTGSQAMTSEDEGFGTFSDEMPWGTHELYFIGHNSEVTDFTDGVATFGKVSDTFTHYVSMTVDENTNTSQTFTLGRRVAKFELKALDAIPDNVASMIVKITGGAMSVNAKTGEGGAIVVQQKTINIPASLAGTSGNTFSSYIFLPDGVTSVNIIVTTLDSDGNELIEYDFGEVEVKTNVITRYKGRMFGLVPEFEIFVDDEWAEVNESEF